MLVTSILFFSHNVFNSFPPQKSRLCGKGLTFSQTNLFNPLPDKKFLGLPKLKAFVDDKLNVTQNIKVVFHRIDNIVGKEENAGYRHFLLFPQCFHEAFSSSPSEVVIVW